MQLGSGPAALAPWAAAAALFAALVAAGTLLFSVAVLAPAAASVPDRERPGLAADRARHALARLALAATLALFAASLLQLLAGTPPAVASEWDAYALARTGLALAAAVLLLAGTRAGTALLRTWAPAALLAGALATFSLAGHAAAAPDLRALATLADYAHLLAAALWTGGLGALLTAALVLCGASAPGDTRPLLAAVAARFTPITVLGLGTLLLTGLYSAWLQVTAFEALGTPYGVALLTKLALAGGVAVLAAGDAWWLRPRLARPERAVEAVAWYARLLRVEVALAVLVVLASGFLVTLEPARLASEHAPFAAPETGRALWAWLVVGVGMLALVVAPRAWRTRIARTRVRILATTVVMAGIVLVYGAHVHGGPATARANPVPASAASLEAGRALYQQECESCHGPSGLGDGPRAKELALPPADLRAHVPLHGDAQTFEFIHDGFPASGMPAFADTLTDRQIWDLVNYLRDLTATPAR